MQQETRIQKSGKPGIRMSRTVVLLVAVLLLIGATVGSTVAFLTTKTEPVTNTFTYAKVSCEVTEEFKDGTKKNVQVKNTGTTDAYIRATYVVNWVDASGRIAASNPEGYRYTLTENPDNKWTKGKDCFFYYTSSVAPGASTEGSLLTCTVTYPPNPAYTLSVEILAEAIQSVPEKAVQDAWGVTVSDDGTLSVQ